MLSPTKIPCTGGCVISSGGVAKRKVFLPALQYYCRSDTPSKPRIDRAGARCYNKSEKQQGKEFVMKKLDKVFLYISFGFLGLMLILLCAMGIVAREMGGVGIVNDVLKGVMYGTFGVSVVFFILSFIFDVKRRKDGRK